MNQDDFNRERLYQTTVAIAKTLLDRNLITKDDFSKINKMMLEKYKPLLGSLSGGLDGEE